MALSEEMRHRIYSRLQELMGGEETAALMAQFPPVAWAEVATKHDVEHSMELVRGDIARLDARIDQVSELLGGRIDQVSARIDHIDSGLTEVARGQGEAKAALRTLFVGLVALQISAAGLVVGVAHLI